MMRIALKRALGPALLVAALAALALGPASPARAQVAVPDFPPAAPRVGLPTVTLPDAGFTPENPAATLWGSPSRFGMGQLNAKSKSTSVLGTSNETYDGYYAGLRWVSEVFALGGELVNVEASKNAYKADVTNAAAAFPINPNVALGAGLNDTQETTPSTTDTTREPSVGISVSLDDRFFIGVAAGRDYLEHTDKFTAGADYKSNREVQKVGLGFRSGGRGTAWHLEYYTVNRAAYQDANGIDFDKTESRTMVVEVNWNSIFLGASSTAITIDSSDGTIVTMDAGWAPKKGLALLGHVERNDLKDNLGSKLKTDVTAISIAYQF